MGRTLAVAVLGLVCQAASGAEAAWPKCDNRAYRDDEVEPGGLKLLGVKESPLGDYPEAPAALTHEHFFQQLREVWTDDCPRVMVQLGLQPAAGRLRNWTAASLWLRYFNHSGVVLAVDPVEDYLKHFEDTLGAGPWADVTSSGQLSVAAVRAAVASAGRGGAKAKDRAVSFDAPGGGMVLAADEVMGSCADAVAGPDGEDPGHPCARIRRRMAQPEPLEYFAPVFSFDEIWRRDLQGRHVDFLQVDLGAKRMGEVFRKGFAQLLAAREVSVLSFRIDALWTKAELKEVVDWLDEHEYFALFKTVCPTSSQAGSFEYLGPGGVETGPTTYLPLSGIDFDKAIDWARIPWPQDVLAIDLKQPDIFKTVQLGDVQCDADESLEEKEESCAADGSGKCLEGAAAQPPERPQHLRVARAEPTSLTIEWQAHPEGASPESYAVWVEPGGSKETVAHDVYDTTGVQTHTLRELRPDTAYTVSVQAVGAAGASAEVRLPHRTERSEAVPVGGYDILEELHCGMSASEEMQPTGPPPQGTSFYREVTDPEGCRAKCDDFTTCVAFQVKVGEACWLYRRRPREGRVSGPKVDMGWVCGVRKPEA